MSATTLTACEVFSQRFRELFGDREVALTGHDIEAFRRGDITYFERQKAAQDEKEAAAAKRVPSPPAPLELGDLERLEQQWTLLDDEEARFQSQLQTVKTHEKQLAVKEKAAQEVLRDFEHLRSRDASWSRQQAKETLAKIADERAAWAKQRERSTRWLAAVQSRIEAFPQDELVRLRKLAKTFDKMRQGIARNKHYGQD